MIPANAVYLAPSYERAVAIQREQCAGWATALVPTGAGGYYVVRR
jgi:hypothetical protein